MSADTDATVPFLLGTKLEMTQIYGEDGEAIPVTAVQAGPCWVTKVCTGERDGYDAVQLGFRERKRKAGRAMLGHVDKAYTDAPAKGPKAFMDYAEHRLADGADAPVAGTRLDVSVFEDVQRVDVIGTSKGRGFAGTIKRHNFARQPKTHGQSDRERAPGSIGQAADPARVFKGTRMAGRYGGKRITVKNLEVVRVIPEQDMLLVRGAIPGPPGGTVQIRRAKTWIEKGE